MNGLILAPESNSGGKHPHDATGAFQPGASAFRKHYELAEPVYFDNTRAPAARFEQVLGVVKAAQKPLDVLAYFGHGWRTGSQMGLGVDNVDRFAAALAAVAADRLTVCLYACSTAEDDAKSAAPGDGNGSLADELRDALVRAGKPATVVAHATVGHAFHNPYVRVFDATTDRGGRWLVDPRAPKRLFHEFATAMQVGDLWMRMPFMSSDDVIAEVRL